ncbi:hypothetical protein OCGS_0060 [Oceaniovalibus guishaninsula JLT2003]|uniref:PH domain-containing protein n=1 Tax=Oceaniovalibus guishaninsula JLT2003 TaxID=1231392 RepID=K2HT82_9RHOB|nr:hypothetical protein [Oceaniovalibus guishaninsula]EKE45834.1 hypothetical protein OCGS_0060 [Oceaniovalibus guishaninsula JLT2003]
MSTDPPRLPLDQEFWSDPDRPLARLGASQGRRIVGAAMTGLLGALLIYAAVTNPNAAILRAAFVTGGLLSFLAGWKMWTATAGAIVLTGRGLFDQDGRVLAPLGAIASVDRGVFAFKPSNGFILRLRKRQGANAWAPGLWWRVGRLVGVGGITTATEARFMVEILTELLARRDACG